MADRFSDYVLGLSTRVLDGTEHVPLTISSGVAGRATVEELKQYIAPVAYGGLAIAADTPDIADGSFIQNWTNVEPFQGTPLNLVVDDIGGSIQYTDTGIYMVTFSISAIIASGVIHTWELADEGVGTGLLVGADVGNQNTLVNASFSAMLAVTATHKLSIIADASAGVPAYNIVDASFNSYRIG